VLSEITLRRDAETHTKRLLKNTLEA